MIWAIILAAGESKRMGRPKLLLPFGERTIIETVVDNAVRSKADEVLVVLGSDAEKIGEKIKSSFLERRSSKRASKSPLTPLYKGGEKKSCLCRGANLRIFLDTCLGRLEQKKHVTITVNPNFRQVMLSSIQWGFESLPEDTSAALVILGDQPMIPSSVIDKMVDAYKQTGKGIALPVYNKRRGHPILVDMKYRDEVERLSPDIGLRALVHNHAEDILEVEVDAPGILRDIDTVEDYSKEREFGINNGGGVERGSNARRT
jgi:molybdenum cofactor cytidylyltransferase